MPETKLIEKGSVVFLQNGKQVEVQDVLEKGFLVADTYENPYWEETDELEYNLSDITYFVEKVFLQAPTEICDNRIVALRTEIQSLQSQKDALTTEIRQMNDKQNDVIKRLKKHKALEFIDDFLEGKITHYALLGWECEIVEREKYLTDERWNKRTRLLSLYGNNKDSLNWGVNEYWDGSGMDREVVPCRSLEEAIEALRFFLPKKFKEYPEPRYFFTANKYNIKLDDESIAKMETKKIQAAEKQFEETKSAFERAKNNLETIKSTPLLHPQEAEQP